MLLGSILIYGWVVEDNVGDGGVEERHEVEEYREVEEHREVGESAVGVASHNGNQEKKKSTTAQVMLLTYHPVESQTQSGPSVRGIKRECPFDDISSPARPIKRVKYYD